MAQSYQEGHDETYCYPGTNTLKNKLQIKNADKLLHVESDIVTVTMSSLITNPVRGNLDLTHLQKIHERLFHDIYEWAGQIRSVNIAKGNLFCTPEFISDMAGTTFKNLQKENYLIGSNKDTIYSRLAFYTGEINAMHPFREGNGRTQREFIRNLGIVAGYDIDFQNISKEEMIKVSIASFNLEYKPMEDMYKEIVTPLSATQHKELSKNIVVQRGSVEKNLASYFSANKNKTEEVNWEKEIKQAGFKATKKLQESMKKVDKAFGSHKTVKEIRDLYKSKESLPVEEKKAIEGAAKDFMQQEKTRVEFPER